MKYNINMNSWGRFFTVPCKVAEDCLKLTDGDFYKVLMCLFCSDTETADTEEIAERCGITVSKAEDAVLYWDGKGVISAKAVSGEKAVAAAAPKNEKTFEKAENISATVSTEPAVSVKTKTVIRYTNKELADKAKKNKEIETLYQEIQKIFGRPINGTETAALVGLYEYYGFDVASILIIAQFCIDIGKSRIAYIESVAKDWFFRGITSYTQIEEEIVRQTNQHSFNEKVKTVLEIECNFTPKQEEILKQWKEWEFDIELIDLAGQRCREATNKVALPYINGILDRWRQDNLMTVAQVKKSEEEYAEKKAAEKDSMRNESAETSYDLSDWDKRAAAFDPTTLIVETEDEEE